jgi:predicted helicase
VQVAGELRAETDRNRQTPSRSKIIWQPDRGSSVHLTTHVAANLPIQKPYEGAYVGQTLFGVGNLSQLLINQYFGDLDRLRRVSGASRESVVREAFKDLLKAWGRSRDLQFIPEHEFITPTKERRYIDGALLHSLRVPFGYWEAKDTKDDLDEEIAKKFRRGYPQTNIIFEDSVQAILIQSGQEVMRCAVEDVANLQRLLELFFGYQRPEIADFRKAVAQFKLDLPAVLRALRERIDDAYTANEAFAAAARDFLKQAKETINPTVSDADVREMLIQHILTEDIFARVFGQSDFHRENNVAKALYALEERFFRGAVKQQTMHALEPYYAAIRSTAALIQSHSEKQGFLKAIYENFYKVYNAKAADRLGVVYTPNEIVRFMVESADWLCEKHFGKSLIDRNVEILDPATGTGTFIVELLEHFRGRRTELKYKYLNEIHANEVAILPYYVANLNIEATYAAITGEYAEFPNLCFVDTLDNTAALKTHVGQHYADLLGGISTENVERTKRQNDRKISVIIGNPPYSANQQNENENNKNRTYPEIDKRIKATYIKESTAQKTKLYDMYSRFFRWASDRIEENGILAFVTNRGFLDKRNFDGFRKLAAREFSDIYVVDLGGDVRDNPRLSGTTHNVFGIQIGVAISFLVKRREGTGSRIHYGRRPEFETKEEKLVFLHNAALERAAPEHLRPDATHNWLNAAANDFETFLPLVSKNTKAAKGRQERAVFRLFSLGIATNRDEWIYDKHPDRLTENISLFVDFYESERARWQQAGRPKDVSDWVRRDIKWTSELEALLCADKPLKFREKRIRRVTYRPFVNQWSYYDHYITHRPYQNDKMYPIAGEWTNSSLIFTAPSAQKPWMVCASSSLADLHYVGGGAGSVCVSRYRYADGQRLDNITDWALAQFVAHYGQKAAITKDHIFAYVYGVLHDPVYRETYALNLKREFPRIPFYPDFRRWRDWAGPCSTCISATSPSIPFPSSEPMFPTRLFAPWARRRA